MIAKAPRNATTNTQMSTRGAGLEKAVESIWSAGLSVGAVAFTVGIGVGEGGVYSGSVGRGVEVGVAVGTAVGVFAGEGVGVGFAVGEGEDVVDGAPVTAKVAVAVKPLYVAFTVQCPGFRLV